MDKEKVITQIKPYASRMLYKEAELPDYIEKLSGLTDYNSRDYPTFRKGNVYLVVDKDFQYVLSIEFLKLSDSKFEKYDFDSEKDANYLKTLPLEAQKELGFLSYKFVNFRHKTLKVRQYASLKNRIYLKTKHIEEYDFVSRTLSGDYTKKELKFFQREYLYELRNTRRVLGTEVFGIVAGIRKI